MTVHRAAHVRLGFVLLSLVIPSIAAAAPPGYTVTPVHTGLSFTTAFRFLPDGRLLYLEIGGRVMVFDNDADPTPSVWAMIPTHVDGERGLLGIALHPTFADSPYVYFYHSNPSPLVSRIVRLEDQGATGTALVVIRDDIPGAIDHHLGGRLAFGPDGMLWVTYGDQADMAAAQSPTNIRGKLLRLTPMGANAPGNAFGAGAVMGVRNSFGIGFDPLTGRGYFTDNGPACDDELNLIEAGQNYGWGPADGCGSQPAGTRLALASFTPTFAPTSCTMYRGTAPPDFDGQLFFGGYVDGRLRRVYFQPGSDGTVIDSIVVFHQASAGVLDVVVGNDGKLWFSTSDAIYRIDPPPLTAVGPPPAGAVLRIAPNPFAASVTIAFSGPAPDHVEVLDLGGRRLRRWDRPGAVIRWDGGDETGRRTPPGLYVLRALAAGRITEARIVRLGVR